MNVYTTQNHLADLSMRRSLRTVLRPLHPFHQKEEEAEHQKAKTKTAKHWRPVQPKHANQNLVAWVPVRRQGETRILPQEKKHQQLGMRRLRRSVKVATPEQSVLPPRERVHALPFSPPYYQENTIAMHCPTKSQDGKTS